MPKPPLTDWNPRSAAVLGNQNLAYDRMRRRCPVAHSDYLGWSLFRHADVRRVLADHETFSNAVSRHRSVPNGMDPPEHTAFRAAIESFLCPERVAAFEPRCREIAVQLLQEIDRDSRFDFQSEFSTFYSLQCQVAFVGWPVWLAPRIADWSRRSRNATLKRDNVALVAAASEFRACVGEVLHARRNDRERHGDVIDDLLRLSINGAPLGDDDIASILRNWTVGEVASLVAALGVVIHRLATQPDLQALLRINSALIPEAIDECLRLEGPLVCNKRVATRNVRIGGRRISAGDRISLMWISANRDDSVFEDPGEFRLGRDQEDSLVWGEGIHVCPGAPLARMELAVAVEEILKHSGLITLGDKAPRPAVYPANGWESLGLKLSF